MATEAEVLRYHPGAQAGVDEIAAAVLAVAQEAEEADAAIRAAIVAAARRGDTARVLAIAERWSREPSVDLAASL